jgi:hypothetical protein
MKGAAALLCAGLLTACAHDRPRGGPPLQASTAEGWSPVVKDDPAGTRRRALAEAQRSALEAAVGVRVSARTNVSQAVTLEQKITSRTRGVIRSYDVLSEKKEEGFHKIRIRAMVELNAVDATDGPTVAVNLHGQHAASAAAGVKRGLIERGFSVLDAETTELVVNGEVTVRQIPPIDDWSSCRALVTLSALRRTTGEILWQESREASALDPVVLGSEARASESAGLLGGTALAKAVIPKLVD